MLLPVKPNVPVRFVFCHLMVGYMMNATRSFRCVSAIW
jgi:hypothetical protein